MIRLKWFAVFVQGLIKAFENASADTGFNPLANRQKAGASVEPKTKK